MRLLLLILCSFCTVSRGAEAPPVAPATPSPGHQFPVDFELESALYLQRSIGLWMLSDAVSLFGQPLHDRPSYSHGKEANGRIYAFSDPTGQYKEFELDFDDASGRLRTVIVYPFHLTWQQCRRLWGTEVFAAEAPQGRTFYSYVRRNLDVLVDRKGTVISFGLY